jgi:DNA-binding MarR family transcriptional regulator
MAKVTKADEEAVAELLAAMGQLIRRLRAESNELSWSQVAIMTRLDAGAITTADLARAEGMKPQSMGTTIAALEDMGIVERKPHPTDGRQMNIQLTPKAAVLRKSARDAKRTWFAQAVARLDKDEQETLFAAGEIIKRLVEL